MRPHIARIQEAVRRMVEDRGPYWAPVPADVYLGDRVAALRTAGGDAAGRSAAGRHLAEVVVAATALANSYGISLQGAFHEALCPADLTEPSLWSAAPLPLPEVADRLDAALEAVRRTMAFHRSDARQGSDPDLEPLHRLLPPLLRAAIAGFASYEELGGQLVRLLESTRTGEPAPVEAEFDPSRAESVRIIRPVQRETFCPFAAKSVLWGPPSYDEESSFEDNMRASLPAVRRFLRILDRDVLDGFVYAFPTRVFGDTFEDLTRVFRDFVEFLHRNLTEAAPAGLDPAIATRPEWYFVLDGEECFVSVFAPCYPHDHSRYMNGVEDHFLFMLQPEAAILRVLTKDDYHPRSEGIRQRFRDGFQRYPLADLEIDRFLLPLRADDPPVRWYELPARL
ncbi:YqcI/YcgG family protein [Streptomyces sp. NPDC052040]|uniref:YqcI/YcgG family protein n=1 Tax=unclassified Streptomyces TaxID=2593676 RepID=UPI0037CF8FA5